MTELLLTPSNQNYLVLLETQQNVSIFRQQTLQKYQNDNLHDFCDIHDAQNADNAKKFGI